MDDSLLEALEDYMKRQRKRLSTTDKPRREAEIIRRASQTGDEEE